MSDRAMRVALVAIREITDDERVLTIVEEALAGRRERGEGQGPLSPAEKMKRYRERLAARRTASSGNGVTEPLPGVTEPVTEPVTGSVTIGAPPDPPEISPSFSDVLPSERGSETRVRAAHVTGVTEPVTDGVTASVTAERTRAMNVTGDGCFGDAVKAWAGGVEAVTKRRFQLPRPGSLELSKLVDALVAGEPELAKREAWARTQGEAFARARAGKTLNVHAFVDWRNSPEELPPDAKADEARKRADARAAEDDAKRKDYLAKATPATGDILAGLEAALTKKRA
jgi:hypothetical protein